MRRGIIERVVFGSVEPRIILTLNQDWGWSLPGTWGQVLASIGRKQTRPMLYFRLDASHPPFARIQKTRRMLADWAIPELLAAIGAFIAFGFGGATVGGTITGIISGLIGLIATLVLFLVIQGVRSICEERKLNGLRSILGDGMSLAIRTIGVAGNCDSETIRPFERQWFTEYRAFIDRAENEFGRSLNRHHCQIMMSAGYFEYRDHPIYCCIDPLSHQHAQAVGKLLAMMMLLEEYISERA